jgi:hypothetical protein
MKILLSLILVLFSLSSSPTASANCGSSSCPIDHHSYMMPGMFRIGATYESITMDKLQFGTNRVSVGQIPVAHDELETINQRTVLNADYGVSSRLSFNVMAPYIVREHSHIHHGEDGDQLEHWHFSGIGDVMMHGTYVLQQSMSPDVPYIALTAGIKLPTGATNKANEHGEKAEVTIQPGTGSYDGILSLNGRYVVGTVKALNGSYTVLPLTSNITVRINGKGKDDYRIGNEIVGSLGSMIELDQRFRLLLQFNARSMGRSDVGTTGEESSNTGGTWVFLTPGIGSELFSNINLFVYVQIPLYQNVHGVQQVTGVNVQAGISYNANLF